MPFQRQYTREEVKGMIQLFIGNRAIQNIDPATHQIDRARNAAHPDIHAGASYLDQRDRVNTPREPRLTGTYWNEDDQIDATMHIINSHAGQIQLRQFDIGETRVAMEEPLPPGQFRISTAEDASNLGAGNPGHVGRNNQNRIGAGANHQQGFARNGFVLLIKGVGGLLQVQTSFPIM